jgi:hypothetical protein
VGHSMTKKKLWASSALMSSGASTDFLFDYPHGDMLLKNAVQIVRHGNYGSLFGDEQFQLFSQREWDMRLNLSSAFFAPGHELIPAMHCREKPSNFKGG